MKAVSEETGHRKACLFLLWDRKLQNITKKLKKFDVLFFLLYNFCGKGGKV